MTQKELIIKHLNDTQLKVDEIPWTEEGIAALQNWLSELEAIVIEAKTKATKVSQGLRERKQKLGKGIWDKGTLPMENIKPSYKAREAEMTKLEKTIKGFIESGYDDTDLYEFFGDKNKDDVKRAISRIRGIE